VPRTGTVQVTLFNPNGTVVKMFVVRYDLSDMPPNSRTFLRQRTLFMPNDASENDPESRKWLRYLIHLRFQSSKSGRIRLHTDLRVLVGYLGITFFAHLTDRCLSLVGLSKARPRRCDTQRRRSDGASIVRSDAIQSEVFQESEDIILLSYWSPTCSLTHLTYPHSLPLPAYLTFSILFL